MAITDIIVEMRASYADAIANGTVEDAWRVTGEALRGLRVGSEAANHIVELHDRVLDWSDVWPVIDAGGIFTGQIVDNETAEPVAVSRPDAPDASIWFVCAAGAVIELTVAEAGALVGDSFGDLPDPLPLLTDADLSRLCRMRAAA